MYELIQLTQNDYYVDCPSKIGIVKTGGDGVVLIDSGNDKDAGKKVLRILEENGWKLVAIYNTHSHADHIGGNKLLQDRTGCKIFAKGLEAVYTNNPVLEPVGLYGGLPLSELKHKFLMAQQSQAFDLRESDLPDGMKLLSLPGHSPDMVGFLTADKTAFIGDCISSEETLKKYGIGYMWDPKTAKETLEYIKTVEAEHYVPSHAGVCESITEIADINEKSIDSVFDTVLSLCSEAVTFEKLLKKIFDVYGLQASAQQFALVGSTLRAYLTNLADSGKIAFEFSDNEMLWKQI